MYSYSTNNHTATGAISKARNKLGFKSGMGIYYLWMRTFRTAASLKAGQCDGTKANSEHDPGL